MTAEFASEDAHSKSKAEQPVKRHISRFSSRILHVKV